MSTYRCRRCGKSSLECRCITTAGLRLLSDKELRRMLRWADTQLAEVTPMHIMPYNRVIGTLLANPDAWQAVLYLSPKRTVRATRRRYLAPMGLGEKTVRRKPSKRAVEVILTDGPPNYRERAWIRKIQEEKRGFPVETIQIR